MSIKFIYTKLQMSVSYSDASLRTTNRGNQLAVESNPFTQSCNLKFIKRKFSLEH